MIIKQSFFLSAVMALLLSVNVAAAPVVIPTAPSIHASSYLLMDADSGKIIVASNEHERLPPASLTKLMTSHIATVEIDNGNLNLQDQVPISVKAWRMEGSKMYIREGTQVSLQDLLSGIVIQSGNDASVAVAEYIGGSEEAFAGMMNQHAELIGMKNSNFVNASGWPAKDHYTSAYDLGLLAREIIQKHPKHYGLYKQKYFTFNNIRQPNRNKLLWRDKSVDGLKTGHTEAAGFCLVSSAVRGGMRLIAVVMGTASEEARAQESQKLLNYGFRYFETVKLYQAQEELISTRLWMGQQDQLRLGVAEKIVLTVPRGKRTDIQPIVDLDTVIKAPINKGDEHGVLTISLDDEVLYTAPLVALDAQAESGFFARIWDAIVLFFSGLFAS